MDELRCTDSMGLAFAMSMSSHVRHSVVLKRIPRPWRIYFDDGHELEGIPKEIRCESGSSLLMPVFARPVRVLEVGSSSCNVVFRDMDHEAMRH